MRIEKLQKAIDIVAASNAAEGKRIGRDVPNAMGEISISKDYASIAFQSLGGHAVSALVGAGFEVSVNAGEASVCWREEEA